jgi:hypothetical protein
MKPLPVYDDSTFWILGKIVDPLYIFQNAILLGCHTLAIVLFIYYANSGIFWKLFQNYSRIITEQDI